MATQTMKTSELNWRYMMNMFVEGIGETVRMRDYLRVKATELLGALNFAWRDAVRVCR